jgi:hypothetical protein
MSARRSAGWPANQRVCLRGSACQLVYSSARPLLTDSARYGTPTFQPDGPPLLFEPMAVDNSDLTVASLSTSVADAAVIKRPA